MDDRSNVKLAVVVPVKNRAVLLTRTLDALQSATSVAASAGGGPVMYSRPVVVIVDNDSDDGSVEVARSHQAVTRVIHSTATTVAALRNIGAGAATDADALVFLDCDCEVPPRFLLSVVECFEKTGAAAVGCEVRSPVDGHWTERTWDRLHRPGGDGPRHYINSACFCIRREWFDRIGGFDAALTSGEDVDISRRLSAEGGTMWQAESLAVLHLGNPQSLSGLYRRIRWHGSGVWPRGKSFQWSPTSIATLGHATALLCGVPIAVVLFGEGRYWYATVMATGAMLLLPTLFVVARMLQFRRSIPLLHGVALMLLTFTARIDGLLQGRLPKR